LLIGFVVFAVAAFICLSLPTVHARLMQSHQATRWFMWQGALRMILDRPIFGWGSGMFLLRFADYKPTGAMEFGWLGNITIYPHDELLLVAVEGGVIALGLYLAGHFFAVRDHLRKAQAEDAPLRIAAWAVFGGLLAMFTHGLVEVSLRFWAPAAAYWTLLGVMIASGRSEGAAEDRTRLGSRADGWLLFASASVMVIAAALGVVYSGARAEWLLGPAGTKEGASLDEYVRNQAEAARLSRYPRDYMIALTNWGDRERRANRTDAALAVFEKVERTAPGYGPVRRFLAELYRDRAGKTGPFNRQAAIADLRKALEWIKLAIRQDPYDANSRVLYAELLLQASPRNLPAAVAQLQEAVKVDPKRMEPRFRRDALALLDEAAALCPPGDSRAEQIRKLRSQIAAP
jgi:tetratricopeptide (TPR) repeat protein